MKKRSIAKILEAVGGLLIFIYLMGLIPVANGVIHHNIRGRFLANEMLVGLLGLLVNRIWAYQLAIESIDESFDEMTRILEEKGILKEGQVIK